MDLVGTTVGHIRVVARLGSGGTGTVYEGFDERLKRRVALKALHRDRFSRDLRARFLREARILSRLDDARICRIHEYLDRPDGDLLVLELVEGRTLEAVLAEGPSGSRSERLRIAEEIAEALERAHAAGVVHRDLKPANVMLLPDGGVKILDFGIATSDATDELPTTREAQIESRETALVVTRVGSLIGTVAYMSPEQARGETATPASDLFALGILLQELLTGRAAYPRGMPVPELLVEVASARTTAVEMDDPVLVRLLERLKSFRPEDRPTASETLAVLRRVRDRPRRRLRIAAGIVAGVLVAAAVAKYTVDLRRERNAAVAERDRAEAARREALTSRRDAEEVADFLVSVFQVADPTVNLGRDPTAREILARARDRIAHRLAGQPSVQARMWQSIGRVYRELGEYAEAETLLRSALAIRRAEGHPGALAETLRWLGVVLDLQAKREEAQAAVEEAIRLEAEAGLSQEEARSWNVLGEIHRHGGDPDAAAEAYRRAEALFAGLPEGERDELIRAAILNNLAGLAWRRNDLEEAERLMQRADAIEERLLNPDDPRRPRALNNLGQLALARGRLDDAERLFRRALAMKERVFGPDHPALASTVFNLGEVADRADRPADAEPFYRRALALDEAAGGPDHPDVAADLTALAGSLAAQGRSGEAVPLYRRALAILASAPPDDETRALATRRLAELEKGIPPG